MLCTSWGVHDGGYEICRLLGYKTPVRTAQETHYVSPTESSRLMLCTIWGFHGGDSEEWRLLRYKNPVCTSQETHYVSVTESRQLMLCKFWDFHGGDYEDCPSSGMLRRVALVRTEDSEEISASITRVTIIGELGTTLAISSNRRTLRKNTKSALFPRW
jgi:hypothetical protein